MWQESEGGRPFISTFLSVQVSAAFPRRAPYGTCTMLSRVPTPITDPRYAGRETRCKLQPAVPRKSGAEKGVRCHNARTQPTSQPLRQLAAPSPIAKYIRSEEQEESRRLITSFPPPPPSNTSSASPPPRPSPSPPPPPSPSRRRCELRRCRNQGSGSERGRGVEEEEEEAARRRRAEKWGGHQQPGIPGATRVAPQLSSVRPPTFTLAFLRLAARSTIPRHPSRIWMDVVEWMKTTTTTTASEARLIYRGVKSHVFEGRFDRQNHSSTIQFHTALVYRSLLRTIARHISLQ